MSLIASAAAKLTDNYAVIELDDRVHTAHVLEGRRRIHTYNAASNAHMIAVNEAMGFRQVAWAGEYIRTI